MGRLGGKAGIVGLMAFLAVDVLLVAYALNSTSDPVAGGGSTIGSTDQGLPSATASSTVTPSTSRTPSRSGTPATSATPAGVQVAPLTVGVVAIDGRTALRFASGACDGGGGTVELTRNGGASWGPRSAPFDMVTRIRVRSDGSTFAVGANGSSGCSAAMREASSYDADWRSQTSASGAWYRDPRDTKRVGLRSGGTGKPCGSRTVVDLSVLESGAAVLCADGAVRTSTTGSSWQTDATVPGALAVALAPKGGSYAALPAADGCDGIAVVDADKPGKAVGCVAVALAEVEPGTVALSVSSDGGWLLVGGEVYRSQDDLATWKKA